MGKFDESKHSRGGNPRNVGQFSAHIRDTALAPPQMSSELRAIPPSEVRFSVLSDSDLRGLPRTSVDRVLVRYQARLTSLAFNDAALEGNTFTLPEVERVRTGELPAGRTEDEVNQILALTEGSEHLIGLVSGGSFKLDQATSDKLHGLLAQHEVIDAGKRRGTGVVQPDDGVGVNVQGQRFTGYPSGDLPKVSRIFDQRISEMKHPVVRALNYCAAASYAQYYHDANKRTARYMMNGELLRHGFDAVEIRSVDEREFHNAAGDMFRSGDLNPYVRFLLENANRQASENS